MFNGQTITTLTNGGTIKGGAGGAIATAGKIGGAGGTGVSSAGMITTLTNTMMITGGAGGGSVGSATIGGPAALAYRPAAAQSAP